MNMRVNNAIMTLGVDQAVARAPTPDQKVKFVMSVGFTWFQGEPGPGEAAFDEAGPALDHLQAVPDLDQVAEAGDGEVGEQMQSQYLHPPDRSSRAMIILDDAGVCVASARDTGIDAIRHQDNVQPIAEIDEVLGRP